MVVALSAAAPVARAADTPVDLALVLAVDVSRSMDADEQAAQRDGYVARLNRTRQSVLGADLDSLSDLVSFGVAPAVLGFTLGLRGAWDMACLTYFVVCGVSRLARFKVPEHVVFTNDPLPHVAANAALLAQVFQNLLENAVKFRSPANPRIHVSAVRGEGDWTISVADNGIGIEPQHAEQVFRLFRRLQGDQYEGTGIGLAICRKIIERHGGRIWVESHPGEGAKFCFTLPAHGLAANAAART